MDKVNKAPKIAHPQLELNLLLKEPMLEYAVLNLENKIKKGMGNLF
jgi:hypothetical protein